MNLKFFPIGTVCLVEGVSKKQMVIGYSKSGYDYVAVEYPKGFESDNKLSYFNHEQVHELYSLGYKNEESRIFNGTLVSVTKDVHSEENDEKIEQIPTFTSTFTFDENGVVVSDGTEVEPTGSYKFDRNGVVIADGPIEEEIKEAPRFKFNEDGIVVSDGTEEYVSPVQNKIQFDENGVVISDETTVAEKNEKPKFKFNEDGVVVSDGTEEYISPMQNRIQFDENGVVISDGAMVAEKDASPKFTFNEDGVVVSDGTEEYVSPVENDDNAVAVEEKKEEESTSLEEGKTEEENAISVSDDATIDVSDVVKKIEETVPEEESSEDDSQTPIKPAKKEKRGLFHFGRK